MADGRENHGVWRLAVRPKDANGATFRGKTGLDWQPTRETFVQPPTTP